MIKLVKAHPDLRTELMTHYHNRNDKGLTVVNTASIVSMASTRRNSASSNSTGGVSSMSSSGDEGETEGEMTKAGNLQTSSIPGSLLVVGAMPLASTLQHYVHAGLPVMILAHPMN